MDNLEEMDKFLEMYNLLRVCVWGRGRSLLPFCPQSLPQALTQRAALAAPGAQ